MPTPKTPRLVTRATSLCAVSSPRGMSIMIAIPTKGRKMATVRPQSWMKSSMVCLAAPRRLHDEDQEGREHDGAAEEQRAVLLDLAGLDPAELLPRLLGGDAGSVDDVVDHALVDALVGD